jgi:hypothetical protein
MNDMSVAIEPKSDQLNYDDIACGISKTITITKVVIKNNDPQQKVSIFFEGDNGKPWKPCKTMSRVLARLWGLASVNYVGKSLTLYGDEDVIFGGKKVGGIRISHMSHIDGEKKLSLTESKTVRKIFTVKPLTLVVVHTPSTALIEAAKLEAAKGTEPLKTYWGKLTPAQQKQLNLAELKEIAGIADGHKSAESPTEGCSDAEDDAPAV